MIRFNETICGDIEVASAREWLETNGLGGYASSSIIGMNTRRYHGLLVAAKKPPVGRMALLSKLEETLMIGGKTYELSANRYPGVIHPQGHVYLKEFRLDPFPVFVYHAGGLQIEKSIFMVYGHNTTVVQYELRGQAKNCTLEFRPLIAFRDYHSTTHENDALNGEVELEAGNLKITPYPGLPSLYLAHDGEIRETGVWYRNFEYEVERQRGLDFSEDLFNPCAIVLDFARNPLQSVIASTEPNTTRSAVELRASEIERRLALMRAAPGDKKFVQYLAQAADQFIVKRGGGHSVIAGYHWFTDWGRDTMIALPGLTLSTGRAELAKSILLSFARAVDHGMLPNRFPDAGESPEYNTADATLWFFEAVREFLAHTGDLQFARTELYDVLAEIVRWHECGTRYGIRMDEDGLLLAGEPGAQLTWMDVKIGDWVVTPRQGKPVEIQALWYNALRVMERLSELLSRGAPDRYRTLAERAKTSFERLFWNPAADCLYDVVNGDSRDASIRPNQIFAVSLFHKMVSPDRAIRIVDTVEHHLLTPFGLRSLSPSDPQYRGRYEGDPRNRDSAYHQGAVWPWLMAPFIRAYLEVYGRSPKSRKRAAKWLAALGKFIEGRGVGQLPEVFDGDAPHRPGGCIAQAWTIAELLRACLEEAYGSASPKESAKRVRAGLAGYRSPAFVE
jgi:predicted glycogen debranching enzyme